MVSFQMIFWILQNVSLERSGFIAECSQIVYKYKNDLDYLTTIFPHA